MIRFWCRGTHLSNAPQHANEALIFCSQVINRQNYEKEFYASGAIALTFFLSLMEPRPRTMILHPVSCSSCLAVMPLGPRIRPTKLNCNSEVSKLNYGGRQTHTLWLLWSTWLVKKWIESKAHREAQTHIKSYIAEFKLGLFISLEQTPSCFNDLEAKYRIMTVWMEIYLEEKKRPKGWTSFLKL